MSLPKLDNSSPNLITRYESKYLVHPETADRIFTRLSALFPMDKHTPAGAPGYWVNNVYFETPSLHFYGEVKNKAPYRCKPRCRYYGPTPDGGIWLEVKNKSVGVIWKARRRIDYADWPGLMRRLLDDERALPDGVDWRRDFAECVKVFDARPILHVRYFRSAFVSDLDIYGRITLDRSLSYRLLHGVPDLVPNDSDLISLDDPVTTRWDVSPMVLEVKTETRVPAWAFNLIREFDLIQRGFSKYCYSLDHALETASPRKGI